MCCRTHLLGHGTEGEVRALEIRLHLGQGSREERLHLAITAEREREKERARWGSRGSEEGPGRDLERGLTGAGTTVRGDASGEKKSASRWFHLAALLAVRGRGQGQALDRAAGADAGRHDVLVELGRLRYTCTCGERREGVVSAWWVV